MKLCFWFSNVKFLSRVKSSPNSLCQNWRCSLWTQTCLGWCEVLFIPRSLSVAERRCHWAACWAKEHPGGAELPGLPSPGCKGPSSVWAKLWGVKSEGNVCWLQSPPFTRQWFTWGHPQVRPAGCRLPPLSHEWPRALSPCLFAGDLEIVSHISVFFHLRDCSLFHSSAPSSSTENHLGFPLPFEHPAPVIGGAGSRGVVLLIKYGQANVEKHRQVIGPISVLIISKHTGATPIQ